MGAEKKKHIIIAYLDISQNTKPGYLTVTTDQKIKSYIYGDNSAISFEYITFDCGGKFKSMSDEDWESIQLYISKRIKETSDKLCLCLLHTGDETRLSFQGRPVNNPSANCKLETFSGGHLVNDIVNSSSEFLPGDEASFVGHLQVIWEEYEIAASDFSDMFLNNI